MFPGVHATVHFHTSFPRARGDVPEKSWLLKLTFSFSPRTRGCSCWALCCSECWWVFPAHAGMFRRVGYRSQMKSSFPRARGDVPTPACGGLQNTPFSPRTRGCSRRCAPNEPPNVVFPAHAGMFRESLFRNHWRTSFPRARGDVPGDSYVYHRHPQFSPRTRGCSSA